MNNTNNNTINSVEYSFYNIGMGTYEVYFDGSKTCCLFTTSKIVIKLIPQRIKTLKYKLNKNNSCLIYERVKNLEHKMISISGQYYCNYNIKLICEEKDKDSYDDHKYKEIYIKINNEEPISIYNGNIIYELQENSKYVISDFSDSYCVIITSDGYKYWVCEKVIIILNKYFKYENGKIVCMYNNKKEIAKLTLITEDRLQYSRTLLRSLKLEIDNKEFTFYINRYKNFDHKKEYYFLIFHIHYHSIYGYDYLKDRYYDLSSWKFILKYVNQEIAKKFEKNELQDFYTYLSNDNIYKGLYSERGWENHCKFLLLDEVFEDILDISLLKPVNEWDNEEINTKKKYYEKEYKDNTENNPNKDNIEK